VEVWSDSDHFMYGGMANAMRIVRGPNSPSLKQALDVPDRLGWVEAIRAEVLDQLLDPSQPNQVPVMRDQLGLIGNEYKIFRTATRLVRKMSAEDLTIVKKS
jgi:hypothetical protein